MTVNQSIGATLEQEKGGEIVEQETMHRHLIETLHVEGENNEVLESLLVGIFGKEGLNEV